MSPSAEDAPERELIARHLDGTLDDAGRESLRTWLLQDRERLREYLREVSFDHDLRRLTRERATRHEHGFPSTRYQRPRGRMSSRWRIALAAAAVLALAFGVWAALAGQLAAPRVAEVTEVSGGVLLRHGGSESPAEPHAAMRVGDALLLAPGGSRARLVLADGSAIELAHGAELALSGANRLELRHGSASVRAAKQEPGSPLRVDTPAACATVVGTDFTFTELGGETALAVREGSVRFEDHVRGDSRAIAAGARAAAGPELAAARAALSASAGALDRYLGIDLGPLVGLSQELAFVDVLRQAQTFTTVRRLGEGIQSVDLSMQAPLADGWPSRIEDGSLVRTAMCLGLAGRYPAGDYTLLFDGNADVGFAGDATVAERAPGRLRVSVHPSQPGGIIMNLTRLDAAAPLRDAHLVLPGFATSWHAQPFHPDFLSRWRGCGVLRTAEWVDQQDSGLLGWANRLTESSGPRTGSVPLELQFRLARELGADLWVTLPIEADDSYFAGFARLAHDRLLPTQRLYVQFARALCEPGSLEEHWALTRAAEAGITGEDAALGWGVRRAVAAFAACDAVFAGDPRLVRVLDVGRIDGERLDRLLAVDGIAGRVDALAASLRFGSLVDLSRAPDQMAAAAASMTADVDAILPRVARQRATARDHGLRLLGYAAGPAHFVHYVNGQPGTAMSDADDTPTVGALCARIISAWRADGGDALCCRVPAENFYHHASSPVGELPHGPVPQAYQALFDALRGPRPP
jgi:ferric-dicitrate binding protein FerR (iron transport regulator)